MRLKHKLRKFTRWFKAPPRNSQIRSSVIAPPSGWWRREGSRVALAPALRLERAKGAGEKRVPRQRRRRPGEL
jgi:hypothetical protein